MSTVPPAPPVQNTSIIRKVRGYFNLACDFAGKVFDMIDGPLTNLEQRAKSNFGEIRNRVQQYRPPMPNRTLVGGKKRRGKRRGTRRRN